jgi:stearoyl-CoA desaturase (delta-9 desaturase)
VKPWQWDPSKWTIWTLSKLGLASGLRRVPDGKILLAEMREARSKAEKRLAGLATVKERGESLTWEALHDRVRRLGVICDELEQAVSDRVSLSRSKMQRWRDETRAILRELREVPAEMTA